MKPIMYYIIISCIILGIILYYFYNKNQLKLINKNYETNKYLKNLQNYLTEEITKTLEEQENITQSFNKKIDTLKNNLQQSLDDFQSNIIFIQEGLKTIYDSKKEEYQLKLEEQKQQLKTANLAEMREIEKMLEELQQKYFSTLSITDNPDGITINFSQKDKDDINFLTNEVITKINNREILYKLIWSEYYQKPTIEMLNQLLPRGTASGIYKITKKSTGQSYIGRSTDLKRRITEHIKSVVGISSISDQYIHQKMREEGIWNYEFKIVEICDKSSLAEREKFYIKFFGTNEYGFNRNSGG